MAAATLQGRILRPKNRPRCCDRCGRTYLRRNMVEAWGKQNKGSRFGWSKTKLRVCTDCAPAGPARALLLAASVVVPRSV